MIRVSATLLESFRLLRDFEWMKPEDFANRVKRVPIDPVPEVMLLGTAFHAISEGLAEYNCELTINQPCAPPSYTYDGFAFDAESADFALKELHSGVAEVKAADSTISSKHGDITLVGKADYLKGVTAHEIKTKKGKNFDPLQYADSFQWKMYCRVFGVSKVTYHLVRLDQDKESMIWFAKADTLDMYAYPDLNNEVDRAARECVDYIHELGLISYLSKSSGQQEAV